MENTFDGRKIAIVSAIIFLIFLLLLFYFSLRKASTNSQNTQKLATTLPSLEQKNRSLRINNLQPNKKPFSTRSATVPITLEFNEYVPAPDVFYEVTPYIETEAKNGGGNIIQIFARSGWEYDTEYTINITNLTHSISDNYLDKEREFSFKFVLDEEFLEEHGD